MPKKLLLDLSAFFSDHRQKSYIHIKDSWETISDLQNHVANIFQLRDPLYVTSSDDILYPAEESVTLLESGECLKVQKLNQQQNVTPNTESQTVQRNSNKNKTKEPVPSSSHNESQTFSQPSKRKLTENQSTSKYSPAKKVKQANIPSVSVQHPSSSSSEGSSSESSEDDQQVPPAVPKDFAQSIDPLKKRRRRRKRTGTRGKRKPKPVVFNPETDLDANGFLIEKRDDTPHTEPRVQRLTDFWEHQKPFKNVNNNQQNGHDSSDLEEIPEEDEQQESEEEEMDLNPRTVTGSVRQWCPTQMRYLEVILLPTIAEEDIEQGSDELQIPVNGHNGVTCGNETVDGDQTMKAD